MPTIEGAIHTLRGERVILDADLAKIYGVETKVLNQAVKRSREKFPPDFLLQLTTQETIALNRSQIVTGSAQRHRDPRSRPFAFTEHGAIMAANILNSPQAVQMSLFVVRAFIKMRSAFTDTRELARKLAALEKELKSRLDLHESAIVDVLQRVMALLDPPPSPPGPPSRDGLSCHDQARPPNCLTRRSQRPQRIIKPSRPLRAAMRLPHPATARLATTKPLNAAVRPRVNGGPNCKLTLPRVCVSFRPWR